MTPLDRTQAGFWSVARYRILARLGTFPVLGAPAIFFDVIDPPDHFVRRYEGRSLDGHQWEDARREIKALGYAWDDSRKAFARKATNIMTTRITVKNENPEGGPAVEVDYVEAGYSGGTEARSLQGPRTLVPGAEAQFWVHSAQSAVVREVEQPK